MNSTEQRYAKFNLVADMLASVDVIAGFRTDQAVDTAGAISQVGRLLMTGEGSSRLFPAKSAIAHARRQGWSIALHTEGGHQAQEYDLSDWAVFALSNSGKTAEVIGLFDRLTAQDHQHRYSLSAFADTKLESLANRGYVLTCGAEGAVAATKSVIEQALFYRALLEHCAQAAALQPRLQELSAAFRAALTLDIDQDIVAKAAAAGVLYWAGRNDGVAEELTLKTNEITRKQADFLEGTYAVHGVEEVMNPQDVMVWIDPQESSEEKFHKVLVEGVGLTIVAVSSRQTRFPTIQVPDAGDLNAFVQIAAGWNLLVEIGLHLGVDLDKPQRARKVGNEFEG